MVIDLMAPVLQSLAEPIADLRSMEVHWPKESSTPLELSAKPTTSSSTLTDIIATPAGITESTPTMVTNPPSIVALLPVTLERETPVKTQREMVVLDSDSPLTSVTPSVGGSLKEGLPNPEQQQAPNLAPVLMAAVSREPVASTSTRPAAIRMLPPFPAGREWDWRNLQSAIAAVPTLSSPRTPEEKKAWSNGILAARKWHNERARNGGGNSQYGKAAYRSNEPFLPVKSLPNMLQGICSSALSAGESTRWIQRVGLPLPIYWIACAKRDEMIANVRASDSALSIYKSLRLSLLNLANERWGENAKVSRGKGKGVIDQYEWVYTCAPLGEQATVYPRFRYWLPSSEEAIYWPEQDDRRDAWKSFKDRLKTAHAEAFYACLLMEDCLNEFNGGLRRDTPPPSDDEAASRFKATASMMDDSDGECVY
ncbi:hypothetical protein DACRYDRAFT_114431 [Dacryopinax primogenitus]|uniref:Uncharacterized protein n=1 Tax=Dacryopinax primogenitus (strain DJM 731) TaxID=1858805 RepID=M5GFA4_DACPD|nr:uncharacterized protein DACRYDRAFT_114431 [Dacryopinax primogenitus]EJU03988.1 hypothetical protein DACRYDRAFT_114431 [Dacryopinax primogenitus]